MREIEILNQAGFTITSEAFGNDFTPELNYLYTLAVKVAFAEEQVRRVGERLRATIDRNEKAIANGSRVEQPGNTVVDYTRYTDQLSAAWDNLGLAVRAQQAITAAK